MHFKCKVYDSKFVINLLGRALKMIRDGIYFIVIAFLVVQLFKILFHASQRTGDASRLTQNDVTS